MSFVVSGEAGYANALSRTKLPCLFDAFGGLRFIALRGGMVFLLRVKDTKAMRGLEFFCWFRF